MLPNEEEEKALEEVRRESGMESKAKNNGVVNRAVMKDGTNFFLVLVHYLDTEVAAAINSQEPLLKDAGKGGRAKAAPRPRPRKDKDKDKDNNNSTAVAAGAQQQGVHQHLPKPAMAHPHHPYQQAAAAAGAYNAPRPPHVQGSQQHMHDAWQQHLQQQEYNNHQQHQLQLQLQLQQQQQQQQQRQQQQYSHPSPLQYHPYAPHMYPPPPHGQYGVSSGSAPPSYPPSVGLHAPGGFSPVDYNIGPDAYVDDDLDLLMSPMSGFDDDGLDGFAPAAEKQPQHSQPPPQAGAGAAAHPAPLGRIIDLTPSSLEASKVSKSKIVMTLDSVVSASPTSSLHAAFYCDRPSPVQPSSPGALRGSDLCVCFAPALRLSPQTFKVVPPQAVLQRSRAFDASTAKCVARRAVVVEVEGWEVTDDVKRNVADVMAGMMGGVTSGVRALPTWRFRTHESADCVDVEGETQQTDNDNEDDLDLPAPLPAMASIATALADFPSPPPGVVTNNVENEGDDVEAGARPRGGGGACPAAGGVAGEEQSIRSRKRTASDVKRQLQPDNPDMLPPPPRTTVEDWANEPSTVLGEDSTIGEDVDRHCKIRFVEKIINTIAGHEEVRGRRSKGKRQHPRCPCPFYAFVLP